MVLADAAYSSRAIRNHLRRRGIRAVIPDRADQQANRRRHGQAGGRPPSFDRETYKQRNTVERCMCATRRIVVSPAQSGGIRGILGLIAHLDPNGDGDQCMPENHWPGSVARGRALRGPRDRAKAGRYCSLVAEEPITIKFTRDHALVLSDWLYQAMHQSDVPDDLLKTDRAVWSPIYTLSGALETTLAEIFVPDYEERLKTARQRLLAEMFGSDEEAETEETAS